jgi:hypothetical protein
VVLATLAALGVGAWAVMIRMPGKRLAGPLAPPSERERALRDELRGDVEKLAGEIGERNSRRPRELALAADHIEAVLRSAGHAPRRLGFEAGGLRFDNVEAEIPGGGRAAEVVVIGAHYDSVAFCPGANDNGTGVAALLALARALGGSRPERTLRFVAFANEEPPHFQTDAMGSLVYARELAARGHQVVAMLSLETLGHYDDAPGSQAYPFPFSAFYPDRGDFLAVVGNVASRALVREVVAILRERSSLPTEGAAPPGVVPGVGWSDHWSFWQEGYPAVMLTDTAPFRYPHYHTAADTADKVDYDRLARAVAGIEHVVRALARVAP